MVAWPPRHSASLVVSWKDYILNAPEALLGIVRCGEWRDLSIQRFNGNTGIVWQHLEHMFSISINSNRIFNPKRTKTKFFNSGHENVLVAWIAIYEQNKHEATE